MENNVRRKKLLVKNVGILAVSNFASKILVFFLVPLYTSVLTVEEYGIYDLVVSTIFLIVPIFSLNIVDAVMRFLLEKESDKQCVASIGAKFIGLGVLLCFVFLFILSKISALQEIKGLEVYIFFYYIFYALHQYMIQLAKGLEKIKYMGVAGVLSTIVMIITNIVFLIVFKAGLKGFFGANILCQLIPVVYLFIKIRLWKMLKFKIKNSKLQHKMLVYSIPLILSNVGWWVNSGSDKYVVTIFCGIATNGVLSVAYKIPSILNTIQGIFIQAWQVSAITEYGEEDTSLFYGSTFLITNLFMCMAATGLIMLTKPLASILYAREFYSAWKFVPFLLVTSVINNASGFLGPILSAKKDSKTMAKSALYGIAINLSLNIFLVWLVGAQGVTIATVLASFSIYQIRKKKVGNDIKIKKYNRCLMTWGLLVIQAILEIYTACWWGEIAIVVIIIIINYDIIKNIVINILKNKHKREH